MNQRTGRRPFLRSGLLPGLMAVGLALSACGASDGETASDDTTGASPTASVSASESASESASAPDPAETTEAPVVTEPQCSQVWVADEKMPSPYKGCYEDDTFVKAEGQRCAFGAKLFTYDDRFYAAQFNKINQTEGLSESEAYQKAETQCGG